MKCRKSGCEKETTPGQSYCSRDHAPLGHMSGVRPVSRKKSGPESEAPSTADRTEDERYKPEQENVGGKHPVVTHSIQPVKSGTPANGEGETTPSTGSTKPSVSLSAAGSRTINTLESCSTRLESLMGLLMPGGDNARIDAPKANAICNCAKHITRIARLKLDIAKEIRE